MKDLETLLPMLREFLNERGLNDVKIDLTLSDVSTSLLNETHSEIESTPRRYATTFLMKVCNTEHGTLNLFSKDF